VTTAIQGVRRRGPAGLPDCARTLTTRLRPHWAVLIVLGLGALVRLLTMVAYAPALVFSDSWGYIATAYKGAIVGLPTIHPVGYPLLVHLLTLPDRSLLELVAFQHLAGLGVGIVIYAALIRARVPRWGATAAAALVLFDGYAITLEQYVMSDTFFDVTMLAAALVLVWPRLAAAGAAPTRASAPREDRIWLRAGLCGLLLALAALEREAAPFTIPVFLIYLAWIRAGSRAFVAFLLALVIPLSAYSAALNSKYHVFGLTATSGWTLYGRVGGFADCTGLTLEAAARPLCESKAQRASHPSAPDWYVWGPSPAQRAFDPANQSVSKVASTNATLLSFSETIIRHQPLDFVGAALGDFLRYFTPGATAYNDSVSATSLPLRARDEARAPATRKLDLPGLHLSVRSPSGLVRWYRGIFHVPRPLLALLALAAVLAVLMRLPGRREILLLGGTGVCLLLGTAATGGFGLRYLIPAVPLLATGGALAMAQIAQQVRPSAAGRDARTDADKSATMEL
jgi:Dolichyl-phosphate-mannose-protein mannosyltransferase